jgi:hypothetical protein
MTVSNIPNPKDRIADLLAAYGSDITRWPTDQIHHVKGMPPKERAELFRDEAALDQVLARIRDAHDRQAPSDDLMARIMSARTVRGAASAPPAASAAVIALEPARRTTVVPKRSSRGREGTAVAALLAASLVLGIYVGSTSVGQSTIALVGDLAGLSVTATDVQTSALDDDLQLNDDEGIL